MPRYFYDLESNGQIVLDKEGLDLAGIDAARDEAIDALTTMFPELVADTDRRALAANVRGETGSLLFKVFLTIEVIRAH
ncbi:DUF6894 family protein [Allomesorhizobium alhagi]|uniref:DUF6894 domain-containing protein n=1 Tax=Mesorhizobium alhagi CCNWXJ12-2 TaxID=1107882 RepID=H0I0U3_9HYPH|nr:hypothetical protein MAXJ12_30402 [Mesorhizobium alhagi CCNWXJ12-2]